MGSDADLTSTAPPLERIPLMMAESLTTLTNDFDYKITAVKDVKDVPLPPTIVNGMNFYVVDLKNLGGLVMTVIFAIENTDRSKEELRVPAEIWRRNNIQVSKLILTPKEMKSIALDPHLETADTDLNNNFWPLRPVKSRFQLFKQQSQPHPMRDQKAKSPFAGGQQ